MSASIMNEDGSLNTEFIRDRIEPLEKRSVGDTSTQINAGIWAIVICLAVIRKTLEDMLEKMPPQGGQE